jgi:ribosomal protein S27E
MFSESEYALTELSSSPRVHRGSGAEHDGASTNMITVLEHWVRQDDPVIDELSYEAGLYQLRIQRESVYIRGELVAPRRVFVTVPGFESYEHVGWIVRIDCKSCMVCAKPFAREADKMNCKACGNVVCKFFCGGNSGIIDELPPSVGPVSVCVQCYWGQEPVHAVLHEDELIAPFIMRRTRSSLSAHGNQHLLTNLRTMSIDPTRASMSPTAGTSIEYVAKAETAETVAPRAVTPTPRFVLLTRTHAGRSLYVNVLEHEAISPGTFVAGPVPQEAFDRRMSGSGMPELDGSGNADLKGKAGESYLIFDVSCNSIELNQALNSDDKDVLKCVSEVEFLVFFP